MLLTRRAGSGRLFGLLGPGPTWAEYALKRHGAQRREGDQCAGTNDLLFLIDLAGKCSRGFEIPL